MYSELRVICITKLLSTSRHGIGRHPEAAVGNGRCEDQMSIVRAQVEPRFDQAYPRPSIGIEDIVPKQVHHESVPPLISAPWPVHVPLEEGSRSKAGGIRNTSLIANYNILRECRRQELRLKRSSHASKRRLDILSRAVSSYLASNYKPESDLMRPKDLLRDRNVKREGNGMQGSLDDLAVHNADCIRRERHFRTRLRESEDRRRRERVMAVKERRHWRRMVLLDKHIRIGRGRRRKM